MMIRFKNLNYISLFLITMLIILIAPFKVNAVDTAEDGTTGATGYFSSSCQATTRHCLIGLKGIRIKVVNTTGVRYRQTNIYNVLFDDWSVPYIKQAKQYYTWGDGTCSKMDYINGIPGCDMNTQGGIGGIDTDTVIGPGLFLRYAGNLNAAGTETLSNSSTTWNFEKILTRFSKNKYQGPNYDQDVWNFLQNFMNLNKVKWEDETDEVKNGTFVIVEPTALIKYNGEVYWGTAYELSQLAYNISATTELNSNLVCTLGKYMPCATYLTGLEVDKSNKVEGINYEKKQYFDKITWFSSNEVLSSIRLSCDVKGKDGNMCLGIDKNTTANDICGVSNCGYNNIFSKNIIKGNYGTGMKVFWVGELNPPKVTCSEVDAYNPNLKSTIKREYDRGDLKYYVVTQPPIKYKTKDNVEQKVDLYWYTSECTCYGIIADYKEKTNVDLSTKTKNELQGIFNSSNVFDTLYNQLDKDSKNSDMYGEVTKWTYNKYNSLNCPYKNDPSIPPEPKYNCTPQFNVGNCSNGTPITYIDQSSTLSDEDYWKNCVYSDNGSYKINTHKQSKPNYRGSLSYYDNTLGGRYCEVYCTESLVTNFNANEIYVLAGQHFTWTDHQVSGSRTCKTKSIDWDIFKRELEKDNIDIERAYNEYIAKKLQVESVNIQTINTYCSSICLAPPCAPPFPFTIVTINWKGYTVGSGAAMAQTSSGSAYYGCPSLFPPSNPPTPSSSETASLKNAYERIKNNAINDYNNMVNCYTWNNNNVYNLNPNVTISYNDNTYSYSGNLLTSTKYDIDINKKCQKTTVKVITGSGCSEATCTVKDGCSKKPCTIEEKEIENCEFYNATRSGTASFNYAQSGVFQYVLKEGNKSIHAWELKNYKTGATTPNYIDIGRSNFPVAYKTPSGVYGVGKANGGDLSLAYVKLGHMKNGSTYLDSILSSYDVDPNRNYSNWQCEFTVASKLIPKNNTNQGGINLIYRTIDLNNPFPGSNGQGREVGPNWWHYNDKSNTNAKVQKVITNNRDANANEVYNKDPMYSFELTPAMIKAIREYNKENSYASYAGSLNGESYDFVCKEGTGKNCISEYVSYLIDLTQATGTCVSNATRNSSNVTSFENCRY